MLIIFVILKILEAWGLKGKKDQIYVQDTISIWRKKLHSKKPFLYPFNFVAHIPPAACYPAYSASMHKSIPPAKTFPHYIKEMAIKWTNCLGG